jgi:cytoskeletal protein CcmA (bactofilin family)
MFSKSKENKLESLIGENSRFQGNISVKGTLRIDGILEGDISADYVILGGKSTVKGNVSAKGVTIGGRIEGSLKVAEIVEITPKGAVTGDIFTARLSIAEGGTYNGRISMGTSVSNVVEFQIKDSQES